MCSSLHLTLFQLIPLLYCLSAILINPKSSYIDNILSHLSVIQYSWGLFLPTPVWKAIYARSILKPIPPITNTLSWPLSTHNTSWVLIYKITSNFYIFSFEFTKVSPVAKRGAPPHCNHWGEGDPHSFLRRWRLWPPHHLAHKMQWGACDHHTTPPPPGIRVICTLHNWQRRES